VQAREAAQPTESTVSAAIQRIGETDRFGISTRRLSVAG
jgi:hypothetical protein